MAAALHFYASQTVKQTTALTTYQDVSGVSVLNTSLTVGHRYLILATALCFNSATTGNTGVQVVHGTTVFNGSEELAEEPSTANNPWQYSYMTVWTAVASEDIKVQFKAAANTAGVDQVTLFVLDLTDVGTENTDWFFNENTTATAVPASSAWSATNNASITFTPANGTDDWLVLAGSTMNHTASIVASIQSRLNRDGVDLDPVVILEADATTMVHSMLHARVFTALAASSHTFSEQCSSSGVTTGNRTRSAVFALNLSKFAVHSSAYTAAEIDLTITDYATQTQTASITPTVTGDVWCLSSFGGKFLATSVGGKMRMQVDNVDSPATQTTDTYVSNQLDDARDSAPLQIQTVLSLSNAAHTVDQDGSIGTAAVGAGAQYRCVFAITMEKASGAPAVSDDVLIRFGSLDTTTGSGLVTAVFTATGGPAVPLSGYYYVMMSDWFMRS